MAQLIQLRRDTAAQWISVNPTLASAEVGVETDTLKFKIGDGATAWVDLAYANSGGAGLVYAGTATLATGEATVLANWVTPDTIITALPQAAPSTAGTIIYADPADIVDATSFMIKSDDATDSRVVYWMATEPNPVSTLPGFVMKADSSGGDAYALLDFGSNQTEVWLTYEVGFEQAALDFWTGTYSGGFGALTDSGDSPLYGPYLNSALHWADEAGGSGESTDPVPTAQTWFTVEVHQITTGDGELYVDTTLRYTDTGLSTNPIRKIMAGQFFSNAGADSIAYIRNVKAGTTQGGNDLFEDDFSTQDLSNWTSVVGGCTVVSTPF